MLKVKSKKVPQKEPTEFGDLIGRTIISIRSMKAGSGEVFIVTGDYALKMYHSQECCESVWLDDVVGDVNDLIGTPVLKAEEVINERGDDCEDQTWTFYHISTIKGTVTLRWVGESNGYYSESVDCEWIRT